MIDFRREKVIVFIIIGVLFLHSQALAFDFKNELFGDKKALSLDVKIIDLDKALVSVNGVDTRRPSVPFIFDWGDGRVDKGWFPQTHIYSDKSKNYILKVVSFYPSGKTDSRETLVRFIPPEMNPPKLSALNTVEIPGRNAILTSRISGYTVSPELTYFENNYFNITPRRIIEYVLSSASSAQYDFINQDVVKVNGAFRQVLLKDDKFKGMYSLWYTNPVAFVSGDYGLRDSIQYSSFFHEMAHNYILNTPSAYCYGGKIDGNASAVITETMAQIFQHATAYEMINNYEQYNLSEDLVFELKQSASASILIIRDSYEEYINSGMKFCSWNNPDTSEDESFNTFMVIAYKFLSHAENSGKGYKTALKRMVKFLQLFDENIRKDYSPYENSKQADTFRATYMAAALSYAFSIDLRQEFKQLNFPISDKIYEELKKGK